MKDYQTQHIRNIAIVGHGGEGRTKLHVLRYQARDYLVFLAYAAVLAGVLVLAHFGL